MEMKIDAVLPASTCEAYGHSELDFSLHHLLSASYFLNECARIERQYSNGNITTAARSAHTACVIGGIMVIVASLEATINELFLDAHCAQEKWQKPLVNLLLSWKTKKSSDALTDILRKKRTLSKYQEACTALGAIPFSQDKAPYGDLEHFVDLRNELMHYKPEWNSQRKIHNELKNALENKFPLNPFSSSGLFFPTKCLSHGCISWGLDLCETFIREFYAKIGQPHKYKFREIQLNKEV